MDISGGHNDVNLPFTEVLADRLDSGGNEIVDIKTVITFMANNRIRTIGHLETYNIFRARDELGVAFILLGTIIQRKEKPEPSLGLTLNLVRTSDDRIVWSYVGGVSRGEQRKVMGIGEPKSAEDLEPILLAEIMEQWPWKIINSVQQAGLINIDTIVLDPRHVRPGDEVHSRVRLRQTWLAGQDPRVFFKADNQLYPAEIGDDGQTYEASWVAGEENGRYSVFLLLEWPHYGRTETALLGNYLVDGTPPIVEMELRGTAEKDGTPVFTNRLLIVPKMVIRKPLSRWRLSFYFEEDNLIGEMDGNGNLPRSFVWTGRGSVGDGYYSVLIEVWDESGNTASVKKPVLMNMALPKVDLALVREQGEIKVDIDYDDSKVPLRYWRMEMWTKEGKILTQSEGQELPVKIGLDLAASDAGQEIEGFLFVQDVQGKKLRRNIKDLLPKLEKEEKVKKKKSTGISESWVNEF